jgi:hypothetical protein
MARFYFGLSTTFHDPALSLVNDDGEVVFAESVERCLLYKRAYGLAADVRDTDGNALGGYSGPSVGTKTLPEPEIEQLLIGLIPKQPSF